jgi:hypothetical protein
MPSISVTNPESISAIALGSSTPKLGGVVNISKFSSLGIVNASNQDLTGFQGVDKITALTSVNITNNKIVGDLQDFSSNSNCAIIDVGNNNYNGSMTALLPTGIQVFRADYNNFAKVDNYIHDFSTLTSLAVYDIGRQSDSFGISINTDTGGDATLKWSGPGELTNTSVDAGSIEGAIPESIRMILLGYTNISKDSKRILLTQLYDTFNGKPTNWAKTTAVNGVTYPSPTIGVFNDRGIHGSPATSTGPWNNLLGKHSAVTINAAKAKLVDVGFSLFGY